MIDFDSLEELQKEDKAIYKLYFKLRHNEQLTKEQVLMILENNYEIIKVNQFEDIREDLIPNYVDSILHLDKKELEANINSLIKLIKAKNIDECFVALSHSSYDLATSVKYIASFMFETEKIEEENQKIGILCALLVDYGVVKDPSCFKKFNI